MHYIAIKRNISLVPAGQHCITTTIISVSGLLVVCKLFFNFIFCTENFAISAKLQKKGFI